MLFNALFYPEVCVTLTGLALSCEPVPPELKRLSVAVFKT
jgi:hypothetical protein